MDNRKPGNDLQNTFDRIYENYYEEVYKTIFYIVNDAVLTKDLISDLFYNLWNNKDLLKKVSNHKSYLYIAAKNIAINAYHKQKKANTIDSLDDHENDIADSDTPFDALDRDELITSIHSVIEELPPKRKLVFKQCKIEGLSYKEVSLLYGISLKTIEDHVRKALQYIKSRIDENNL